MSSTALDWSLIEQKRREFADANERKEELAEQEAKLWKVLVHKNTRPGGKRLEPNGQKLVTTVVSARVGLDMRALIAFEAAAMRISSSELVRQIIETEVRRRVTDRLNAQASDREGTGGTET